MRDPGLPAAWAPRLLSVLRIVTGLVFLAHGTQKFLSFPGGEMAGSGWALNHPGHFAGIVELVCGLLIALGLFTRPAAFLAAGFCAVAYWMVHGMQSFYPILNQGELAALYCFVFLYFCTAGPGAFSIDGSRERRIAGD